MDGADPTPHFTDKTLHRRCSLRGIGLTRAAHTGHLGVTSVEHQLEIRGPNFVNNSYDLGGLAEHEPGLEFPKKRYPGVRGPMATFLPSRHYAPPCVIV